MGQKRGGKKKVRNQKRRQGRPRNRTFSDAQLILPPTQVRRFSANHLTTVVNAATQGANTTFSPFNLITYGTSVGGLPGLTSYFDNTTGLDALYLASRTRGLSVRVSCVNLDSTPVEVALVITNAAPATNSLLTVASQVAYLARQSNLVNWKTLSAAGGMDRCMLTASGTLKKLCGVSNVKGLTDAYSNSWDSGTAIAIPAESGMSYVIMIRKSVNIVSGVFCSVEADLSVELFTPNSFKNN